MLPFLVSARSNPQPLGWEKCAGCWQLPPGGSEPLGKSGAGPCGAALALHRAKVLVLLSFVSPSCSACQAQHSRAGAPLRAGRQPEGWCRACHRAPQPPQHLWGQLKDLRAMDAGQKTQGMVGSVRRRDGIARSGLARDLRPVCVEDVPGALLLLLPRIYGLKAPGKWKPGPWCFSTAAGVL